MKLIRTIMHDYLRSQLSSTIYSEEVVDPLVEACVARHVREPDNWYYRSFDGFVLQWTQPSEHQYHPSHVTLTFDRDRKPRLSADRKFSKPGIGGDSDNLKVSGLDLDRTIEIAAILIHDMDRIAAGEDHA